MRLSYTAEGFLKALIYDDEVATGSSVIEMSHLLVENGIQKIAVVCTHGVFVGDAITRLADIPEIIEIVTKEFFNGDVNTHISSFTIIGKFVIRKPFFKIYHSSFKYLSDLAFWIVWY